MLASLRWLSELTGLVLQTDEVAEKLTSVGLEIEGISQYGQGLEQVVVAEVVSACPHPSRDKLQLVTVNHGEGKQEIVCGATNVPGPGGRVVLAKLGAKLPNGMEIAERKLGGVVSCGMLCGETELEIGSDDSGLLILDPDAKAPPGTPIVEALPLVDTVLEIGLTPNRPDCLGHIGIARELGVIYGRPTLGEVSAPVPSEMVSGSWGGNRGAFSFSGEGLIHAERTPRAGGGASVAIKLEDASGCPRYAAGLVDGVSVGQSPFWLRYRLHVLGLRSVSNVVDATNLVLHAFGHPIHAFDCDRLEGDELTVRCARLGESLKTLDGVSRQLESDDLVICDGVGPVALAGVMGGANSEIRQKSSRVLIECAYFNPKVVRRASKRTGLHTDASHRFERGVDPNAVRTVLAYATGLIQQLAGGAVHDHAIDLYPEVIAAKRIELRFARMQSVLGCVLPPEQSRTTLRGLGCLVTDMTDGIEVTVPTHRPDITREIDLIEEVARIAGYDKIPTVVPQVLPSSEGTSDEIRFLRRVRESAASSGLNEAINFAFVSPRDLELAQLPASPVTLFNPMSEDRSVLRTGLLAGLGGNLLLAQRHQQTRFAQFEVSRIFGEGGEGPLPVEEFQLGILLWGERADWYVEGHPVDFYDLKGTVESVVAGLGCREMSWTTDDALETEAPFLHPRRRARIHVAGLAVGVAGELHPKVVDDMGLNGRPIYAALEIERLRRTIAQAGFAQGRRLPKYPSAIRDIAVAVPVEVSAGEVAGVIGEAGGELVEAVRLFDIYTGAPVPDGQKSMAYHVVYRDSAATLTDKKVDKAHARVVRSAEQKFGASLRK